MDAATRIHQKQARLFLILAIKFPEDDNPDQHQPKAGCYGRNAVEKQVSDINPHAPSLRVLFRHLLLIDRIKTADSDNCNNSGNHGHRIVLEELKHGFHIFSCGRILTATR